MKKLKIEKHLEGFYRYMEKAEIELQNVIEEVKRYSCIFPDDFKVINLGGDDIGIMPRHLYEDDNIDNCGTYVSIADVINAMKNKEKINDEWFIENAGL